jgi:phosphohistidine phosphatase SixA
MRVSNLARAKETAQIIHDNMGDVGEVEMADPDELLNEGR